MHKYPLTQHINSNNMLAAPVAEQDALDSTEAYPKDETELRNESKEKGTEVQPRIREYRESDLEAMVALDMISFSDVYSSYNQSTDEIRANLKKTFEKRIELIGSQWTQIMEDENSGEILGFLMSCPTSKKPEDFSSWEDTTDNGSLDTTFDPDGKDIYVISLTTARDSLGRSYEDLLYATLMNKGISEGYSKAFFEARLPGLRKWMEKQAVENDQTIENLTSEEKDAYAEQYFRLTKQRDGKEVPYDPLLRSFSKLGCDFVKVVPEAYQDEPSMNYGVLAVVNNPLPERMQKIKSMRRVVGKGIAYALLSKRLNRFLFQETMPNEQVQNIDKEEYTQKPSKYERLAKSIDRHKTKLVLGAAAISLALTVGLDPFEETKEKVIDAAPWVGGGMIASEALWIGGAAMMLTAVGKTIKNPLRIKKQLPELALKADSSKLFKTGFYVNTTGAVGDFVVLSAGVMNKLPVHSWGILGVALADLGVTVAVRKAMYKGIKKSSKEQENMVMTKETS